MLKTVQYSINIEQLLTVPAKKVTTQAVNPAGYEIYEYDGLRWIRFADGSIQSVMLLNEPAYPLLSYIQGLICSLLFSQRPKKLLNLGLGSGSIERFILSQFAEMELVSVEIDAKLIELTRQHFHIPSSHRVMQMPAQHYLEVNQQNFDILISDVYPGQESASSYLSADFIMHAARGLNKQGVFAVNLLPRSKSEVVEVLVRMRKTFPWILIYDVPDMSNMILFCSLSRPPTLATLKQRATHLCNSTGLDLAPICTELIEIPVKDQSTIK
ncbi:MAG: methyltransferase [Candidatus Thiodiazotropha sp.]